MTAVFANLFGLLFGILASGVGIGIALAVTAMLLAAFFSDIPITRLVAQHTFNILTTSDLVALPLFVMMGEFLFRTNLSKKLFNGLAPWAGLLPGRLLHVNVIACSIFASISGSSAATTQVVGKMTLTELLRRGYGPSVAIGSLAGAGTLGFLIPPSTVMIIYGVLAEESVLRLFTAGWIPGLLLAGCFMGWIMIDTKLHPELIPESERALKNVALSVRIAALKELGPAMFLIVCVIGSMYAGVATPTEAAALGVLGAFIVSYLQTGLNWQTLRDVAIGTVQSCSMMGLIILGASILGNVTAALGVPDAVAKVVSSWELSPLMLIIALMLLYIVLGTALEGFSMIATTLPVVLPLITAAGFDKVWFGIFLVLVVEMAQITPPVAFNLSVLQGITGKSMGYLTRVTVPYLFIMMGFVVLIAVFPGIVLWFPNLVLGR
ncbi:MAG TPA: TRAP transporter large permease subunit [Burkholderiaceae bacterium]|nr:TRAP transporter large permease subunit [Burkholderiaceae bacterium]